MTLIEKTGSETIAEIENKSTGVLQHNLSLVIGTHIVKDLFIGAKAGTVGPIGLFKFSQFVKTMVEASKHDDPYADQFLIRLDNTISKARTQIRNMKKECLEKQESPKSILIEPPTSKEPITIRLQFNTEYTYMAAFMLAESDELIHLLVREVEVGFSIRHELGRQINLLRHLNRKVLSLPCRWYKTEVSRADIAIDNERAQMAKRLMGELDKAVLLKQIAPQY